MLVDAAALPAHLAGPLLVDSLRRPLAHADLVLTFRNIHNWIEA